MKLTAYPNPLADDGAHVVLARPGETVAAVMARVRDVPGAVVERNGQILAPAEWHATELAPDDRVVIRAGVAGDALGPLLAVAVLIAAPYAAAAIAPALGIASAAGIAGLTAGIGAAAGLVVNSLVSPRVPDYAPAGLAQAAPQFSLAGGRNAARPFQPYLLVLGTHRVFPDLAGRPYTEYQDGDQYLGQVVDYGIGDLELSDHRIGEAALSSYAYVETSTASPVTLVSGNVDSAAGADDLETNASVVRTTSAGTTAIGVDLVGHHYRINDRGELEGRVLTFDVEHRLAGSGEPWSARERVLATPDGADAQNLVRQSYRIPVDAGRYDVRVTLRTEIDADDDKLRHRAAWAVLRSYQPDTTDWKGRNPYAIRIRASGQLSGSLDRLSALASQRVPVFEAGAWTADNRVTRNPAALMRAYWRGFRADDGTALAGMFLAAGRYNDEALGQWFAFCHANGLTCDLVLTATRDHNAIMRTIAQCGWASVDQQGESWSVAWENDDEPVSAIITPANIVAGSMSVAYNNQGLADEIIGDFLDAESGYRVNTLRRTVRAGVTPERPIALRLDGITDGENAAKEINRTGAAQVHHGRTIAWTMPPEGLHVRRGRVVGLAHDLAGGTAGGRLRRIDADRRTVRLVPPVDFDGAVWVSDLNGDVLATTFVRAGDDVRLADPIPGPALARVADDPLSYRWLAFAAAGAVTKVRITGTESGETPGTVRITARDEIAAYYAARTSDLSHPLLADDERADLPPVLTVAELPDGFRRFTWAGLDDTPGQAAVVGYQIRASSDAAPTWATATPMHEGVITFSPWLTQDPAPGTWTFFVRAVYAGGGLGEIASYRVVLGLTPGGRAINWTGPWVPGRNYQQGDGVGYLNRAYVARVPHLSADDNAPTGRDESNDTWDLFAGSGLASREITVYRKIGLSAALPAAPAAATWNHAQDTLANAAGWSRAFPAYNPTTERVACTIATGSNDNTLSAWSAVRICESDGDLNAVYIRIRSGVTPDTPPTSALRVPAGWVDIGQSLTGVGLAWVSVGHRPSNSDQWTWAAPVRIQALDGTDGRDGLDGADGIAAREVTVYRALSISSGLPSRPSGGTWNHAADSLSGVAPWSRSFPSYNPTTQRVACSIATGFSTNTLSAWSPVRWCEQAGDLNAVYRRVSAGTTPSRPPSSTRRVPIGWIELANALTGFGLAWVSVGHRPAGSATWTWGTPERIEALDGRDGTDGRDGAVGPPGPRVWQRLYRSSFGITLTRSARSVTVPGWRNYDFLACLVGYFSNSTSVVHIRVSNIIGGGGASTILNNYDLLASNVSSSQVGFRRDDATLRLYQVWGVREP